jgi:hypothetical protein
MRNESLAFDYLKRARSRIRAIEVLMEERSWADVVRESQEAVEILLKGLLRFHLIDAPQVHDVSPVLDANRDRLSSMPAGELDELIRISRNLRRDRELAFYGSEDLTPSEFYTHADADSALASARKVLEVVAGSLGQ